MFRYVIDFVIFQELDNPYYPTINSVIERVTTELKQILKKDFNKKMIESTAFKNFEVWWDEQSRKTRTIKPQKEDGGQPLQVIAIHIIWGNKLRHTLRELRGLAKSDKISWQHIIIY